MACFHPLHAFQTDEGKIVFSDRRAEWRELTLPCGQCVGCRLEKSRQWAVRCMHEASLYDRNAFVTLTYDNEHCPEDSGLDYSHFQKFAKRARRKLGPFRFYMCGEYGGMHGRPHFHACMFGVSFSDGQVFRRMESGCDLYTSEVLSRLWPFGFSSFGEVTFESAAYVARYVLKKTGNDVERLGVVDFSTGELSVRREEFTRMSLKPGIGAPWLEKYRREVYPRDYVVVRGVKCKPPRYYDKLSLDLPESDGDLVEYQRYVRSLGAVSDNTVDRLRVRESVARARLSFKLRSL